MTYKDSIYIFPATSPTSPSLPKYDFVRLKTMNDNIQNYLIYMNNKHQSDMRTMTDSITAILQKLTDGSSKIDKHDKQITEISSKLLYYEDRIDKLRIKDTQIQPLSLQITNTSSKTDKHEVQITEFTSKFSYYEIRLDKLITTNINKIDTAIK